MSEISWDDLVRLVNEYHLSIDGSRPGCSANHIDSDSFEQTYYGEHIGLYKYTMDDDSYAVLLRSDNELMQLSGDSVDARADDGTVVRLSFFRRIEDLEDSVLELRLKEV